MAARSPRGFQLTSDELEALKRAERRFLSWRTGRFAVRSPERQFFVRLRDAARLLLDELAASADPMDANGARLRLRMQEADGFKAAQESYIAMLAELVVPLDLLARACSLEDRAGRDADEAAYLSIAFAADEWIAMGKPVGTSGRDRFAKALREFKRDPHAPQVGGEEQIAAALAAWRRVQGG